jgi:polysaccharide pyruvyl transferase WcaK-like protein
MMSDWDGHVDKTVLILGSFDGSNAGDTAVLWSILTQLDAGFSGQLHFIIPTHNPGFVRHYFGRFDCEALSPLIHPRKGYLRFWGPSILSVLNRCDLVVTTAGIIFDHRLLDFRFNFVSSLVPLLTEVSRRGIPVVGYGLGVVPPTSMLGRWAIRYVLNRHDHIFLRDHNAQPMLDSWRLRAEVDLGADAAFSIAAPDREVISPLLSMCRVDTSRPTLVVNVAHYFDLFSPTKSSLSRTQFEEVLGDVISHFLTSSGAAPVLLCTSTSDESICRRIADRVGYWVPVLSPRFLSHTEILGVLGSARAVIAMRQHACILAAVAGTPVVSLNYSPKVANVMHMIGLEGFAIEMRDVSFQSVRSRSRQAWEQHGGISRALKSKIPQLAMLANAPADMITGELFHRSG